MLATFIRVFSNTRLMPTQKISMLPTKERLLRAASVMMGWMLFAKRVTEPCKSATGIAEKIQPFPKEAVITQIMIKSKIALVNSVE